MPGSVQLREVEEGDLPMLFKHQRDPEAVAMAAFHSRDAAAFDEHWAKLLADPTVLKKTVIVDEQVAGHVVSFMRDEKREVGYWIDRTYWGRGVATEALFAFLCLEKIRPLYAGVARHNVASLRVLEKCGFTLPSVAEQSDDANDSHILLTLQQ